MDRGGSRVGGKRSRTFAGISSRKVGRWNGSGARRRRCRRSSTARRKPGSSPCTRGSLRKGTPTGRCGCWQVVELGIADSISHETVRWTLKKRLFLQKESPVLGDSARKRSSWRSKCLKEKPYDPERPVVCMDEQPVQQGDARVGYRGSSATRRLRVRTGGHRVDLHVLRGPVLLAPGDSLQAQNEGGLGRGSRRPAGRPLRELRAPSCATTSTPTRRERSTKRPARARELVKRACYTPKHGSWLNIAENELRTRQCLRHRRLGDLETLQAEISAWSVDVNERQRGVDWES